MVLKFDRQEIGEGDITNAFPEKISGKEWIKYSISVWDDCKTKEESLYKHPASFPVNLVHKQNLKK